MSEVLKTAKKLLHFEGAKIVTVGLIAGTEILTGKRRDNGLWTSPGGHMDEGETLFSAAAREVLEESGIEVEEKDLELITAEKIKSHRTGKDFVVFGFLAHVTKEKATAKNDPDKEIVEWKWVKLSEDTEELLPKNRHAKKDSVLAYLGVWPEMSMTRNIFSSPRRYGKVLMSKTLGQQSIHERRMALEAQNSSESDENTEGGKKPEKEVEAAQGAVQGEEGSRPDDSDPGEQIPGAEGAEEIPPVVPEPKEKTPEEMAKSPAEYLENGTGRQPNSQEDMPQISSSDKSGLDGSRVDSQQKDENNKENAPNGTEAGKSAPTEGQAEKPKS